MRGGIARQQFRQGIDQLVLMAGEQVVEAFRVVAVAEPEDVAPVKPFGLVALLLGGGEVEALFLLRETPAFEPVDLVQLVAQLRRVVPAEVVDEGGADEAADQTGHEEIGAVR